MGRILEQLAGGGEDDEANVGITEYRKLMRLLHKPSSAF